ncbi:MAG: hypothetical protein ABL933_10630 [Methyloglobulus sp.]|nr:hypothetical protein [Methyloglobulus sp.]
MNIGTLKLRQFALLIALVWANYSYADLVVMGDAQPPVDQKHGYIENTSVDFIITRGQSQDLSQSINGNPAIRAMRRVEVDINDKKIVIQNSEDKELYVKGQDQFGAITTLANKDYATISNAMKNLAKLKKGNMPGELHESLATALSLLASWPQSMPLIMWQDGNQKISVIDKNIVIAKSINAKASSIGSAQAKKLESSMLEHPDSVLHLPDIGPLQAIPMLEAAPTANSNPAAISVSPEAAGVPSSDTSKSLCTKMGVTLPGSYPLIEYSFPFNTKLVGTEKYTATVGGVQCLARCGGGCVDSVTGISGFGKNAYSEDCLDHDMCVTKRGNSSYCNFIFTDAANDFFSTPCGHDLILQNVVVSNTSIATSQLPALSSKLNLFVVFTVKNNANTRLPHNKIFFDISVDGKKKATLQLTRVLNALDSNRYYYQVGLPKSYVPGKHSVSIQINSSTLIQTNTSNDAASRPFNLL